MCIILIIQIIGLVPSSIVQTTICLLNKLSIKIQDTKILYGVSVVKPGLVELVYTFHKLKNAVLHFSNTSLLDS